MQGAEKGGRLLPLHFDPLPALELVGIEELSKLAAVPCVSRSK
jgi:hypothetical protein